MFAPADWIRHNTHTVMVADQEQNRRTRQIPFDEDHLSQMYSTVHPIAEARRRAKNVVNDCQRIGIAPTLNLLPLYPHLSVPYYTFGEPEFSPGNLEKNVPDTLKAIGFGLNWGDLHVLSYACELGRRLWGEQWVLKFKDNLCHFDDHLAMVEELWWIGLWHPPSDVRYEVCLGGGSTKTVDWRFKCCDQIINLEVKFRPKDWKRVVDGRLFSKFHESVFEGVAEKFRVKRPGELNLVGITLLSQLDREAARAADRFLAKNDKIDGVIYWSTGMKEQPPEQFHLKPHAAHVKLLFHKVREHLGRFTLVLHPWRDREKRRAKWLGIDEDLSKIDGFQTKVGRIIIPPFVSLP